MLACQSLSGLLFSHQEPRFFAAGTGDNCCPCFAIKKGLLLSWRLCGNVFSLERCLDPSSKKWFVNLDTQNIQKKYQLQNILITPAYFQVSTSSRRVGCRPNLRVYFPHCQFLTIIWPIIFLYFVIQFWLFQLGWPMFSRSFLSSYPSNNIQVYMVLSGLPA